MVLIGITPQSQKWGRGTPTWGWGVQGVIPRTPTPKQGAPREQGRAGPRDTAQLEAEPRRPPPASAMSYYCRK